MKKYLQKKHPYLIHCLDEILYFFGFKKTELQKQFEDAVVIFKRDIYQIVHNAASCIEMKRPPEFFATHYVENHVELFAVFTGPVLSDKNKAEELKYFIHACQWVRSVNDYMALNCKLDVDSSRMRYKELEKLYREHLNNLNP